MKNIKSIIALSLGLVSLVACDKWTETEVKSPTNLVESNKTDAYYAALRAYKKTDHQIAFGWFGNWTGKGSSKQASLAGLPDSVDVVSIWGTVGNLSDEQKADLKHFQDVKGGRAMLCWIIQDIGGPLTPKITDEKKAEYQAAYKAAQIANGIASSAVVEYTDAQMNLKWTYEYWGYVPTSVDIMRGANVAVVGPADDTEAGSAKRKASAEKYANAICDTLDKYRLDGFDIDYEPNFGHSGTMGGRAEMMVPFIETLGKRIGPKSGTGRLLAIDGEPQSIASETGPYFDYFIVQAYNASSSENLDSRLANTIGNFTNILPAQEVARKYVVTENFEDHASGGGVWFTDRQGNRIPSLLGMATWYPIVGGVPVRKGGVGTYHMEYEYRSSVDNFAGYTAGTPTSQKRNFMDMTDVQGTTYPFLRKAIKLMNPQL